MTLAYSIGGALVNGFHLLALFAIGGAIVWSAVFAFAGMITAGKATVEDILLLFIYLELGAMVGIYFKTNHMPVRFLIYVAITALTRFLIGFVNVVHKPDEGILVIVGGILLLSLSVLVLRFGSNKYPFSPDSGTGPGAGDG
ncbi:MAG: phosphate-starvation-inducible PsiE family protein [Rhodospirillales bacterium]|nr:phosphate-starvation-inducible PsiE family protein [Rhodospirillales bacterium]